MIVSYGSPEYRVLHLNRKFEKFKIEILKIEKDFVEEDGYDKHHYIYLCQKLEGATHTRPAPAVSLSHSVSCQARFYSYKPRALQICQNRLNQCQ